MQQFHQRNQKEAGIVSLFVVIFAALLITTVTIAFVRMMITAQQQATANDLSKSALDSAYAGIEDAKRLTSRYIKDCLDENYQIKTPITPDCTRIQSALDANKCNTIQSSPLGVDANLSEVQIGTTIGEINMDQAYTCVKVNLTPSEYLATLNQNTPILVPLRAENNVKINKIKIEWYSQQDLPGISAMDIQIPAIGKKLISVDNWNSGKYGPPPLRVQLIQHTLNNIEISSFDETRSGLVNSATLFLKPYAGSSPNITTVNFADDDRGSASLSPNPSEIKNISCLKSELVSGGFACKAEIVIPNPIGASDDSTPRTSYILLSQNYAPRSSFRITMDDSTKKFYFVQAKVDSTGRANDLFRRLDVRLNLYASSMSMPQASIDAVNSVCKPRPDEDLASFVCPQN